MRAQVIDTASPKIQGMIDRARDLRPIMASMGRHMMPSLRTNFDVGGRPVAWDLLVGVEVLPKGRTRKGGRTQGRARMGGPLVLTGNLRSSIGFTAEREDLVIWAAPTPGVKGPVHQFGTNRAGRNHSTTIPARPYLVFQAEDLDWFRAAASAWIRVGEGR